MFKTIKILYILEASGRSETSSGSSTRSDICDEERSV